MEPMNQQTNNTNQNRQTTAPEAPVSPAANSTAPDNSIPAVQNRVPTASNSPYPSQPQPLSVRKPDTAYTKKLKEHFSFFGIGSLLYALFYTFCLYRNTAGITYPFFVAGTLCYFFFSMQKLGVPYKKNSIFYLISIVLLGISNCLTNSPQLLAMNKCGIFLLSFILMLHTMYDDTKWDLPKYFTAAFQVIGMAFACLFRPFGDLVSYFDAQKRQKTGKKSNAIPVMIGIAAAIPLLFIVTILLVSADAVFADLFSRILDSINFITVFLILFMITAVFFCSYAVYAALAMKNVEEELTDHRTQDPIIAIIVTATLSVIYLLFSVIQILYLFVGKMQLPEGYTYSSYAREGFFQLLAVCMLNLIIVLVCLYFFRRNIVLKVILTVISGCTFIMILSSALRMLMYINRYNLTLLRILVLWALAVILLLMLGVTVFIYKNNFPLFTYGMAVVTIFYLCLSFAHPDYWIARYNLDPAHLDYLDSYDIHDNQDYLSSLSADAAPILLNDEINFYIKEINDKIRQEGFPESYEDVEIYLNRQEGEVEELSWIRLYYLKIDALADNMHFRSFNFSVYNAAKYLW